MFQMKHRIKMTLCGGNAIFYMATDLHGFQKESILSKLYYKRLINLSSSNHENTLENFEISIFPYNCRTTALVDVTKIAQKHSAHSEYCRQKIDADDNRVSTELLASTEEIWSVTINKKQQVDLIKSDNTWWAAKQITSNRETSIIRKLNIVITAPECIASIMMKILSKNKCTPNASASSKTSTKVDNISQFLWKNNHTQKSTIKKPTQSMDLLRMYNLQREYLEAIHDWITNFGI
ncbi:hypothetical protein D917_08076 [Trichinella nativa]|uniref:Uncharacterized protein n=1 Tax=Trichinella nativa TaxID=6335 RepID=A0A1Y3EQG9_9BILA|nr:hypothetical protein D917_08076 [Trichinella nativa]